MAAGGVAGSALSYSGVSAGGEWKLYWGLIGWGIIQTLVGWRKLRARRDDPFE